ncbi:MAG: hypothetical protein SOW08_02340 [Lachnospiraceae bacterium]|nr:hypothetical protein [Lachnospiraceae bacterium]
MYYKVLTERASFLKEKEEGVNEMCKIMDEMKREAVQDRNYEFVIDMLNETDMPKE